MLKSWSIKNFKPIVDSGELQLAPVTVLAGRNSSGKSSLLQSILIVAQTLGSRLLDRPLLPNERLVQLGTFEDILSEMADPRALELKFDLDMGDEEVKTSARLRRISRLDVKSVQFFVKFSGAASTGTISSAIEASKVIVDHANLETIVALQALAPQVSPESSIRKICFDLQRAGDDDIQRFLENVSPEQQRLASPTGENDNYLGYLMTNEDTPEQYLVALSHFLPFKFTRKYNIGKRRKKAIESVIHYIFAFSDRNYTLDSSLQIKGKSPLTPNLKAAIDILCKENGIDEIFSGQTLEDLVDWTRGLRMRRKGKIFTSIQETVIQEYCNNSEDQNFEGLELSAHDAYLEGIEQTVDHIVSFFTSKIRYLGPLRADPQASQKFGPSSELDDVGPKGEFAAAVYDANHAAHIEWYNPHNKHIEKGRLREALDCWAQYLGVAQQVKTEMAGFSGVAWKIISKEGRKARSLPEVGVGISQILPILIMGLLSPANSLLIIEQPELHLHPYVQARLGDFFMGLAKCKKQCLIETHSENLVSQLRLHIVEAGGLEKSDCIIYFVDQNEKGAAKFEKIEVSPHGNILNWPDGFFDETMLQEDRITAVSLRKRAQEAKHGGS